MDKQLLSYEQTYTSWTDDIPTCRESGVGSSGNEVYKTDGSRIPNGLHPFEDRSFRFKKEEYGLCLYGVFDGFSSGQVADFVMKRLPAELLLGQLVPDLPPEMVREQLKQAFISVDREYFGIIGDRLAARMVMRGEEDRPGRQSQLAELEEQISLTPLSVEHTLHNEDERLRLRHLGHNGDQLGGHNFTRCFGNYLVKGGHKEVPALSACRDDPVIPEPEVQGPIPVEAGLQLMVIATSSLLEAVTRVTGGEARTELSRLISRHLDDLPAASLSTVAQATIDHIVRMVAQQAEVDSGPGPVCREDMTLLIRTFSREGVVVEGGVDKRPAEKTLTTRSSARPPRPTRSSTTTESSGVYLPLHGRELAVDEHGRIEPYVDFGMFYQLWNQKNGLPPVPGSEN